MIKQNNDYSSLTDLHQRGGPLIIDPEATIMVSHSEKYGAAPPDSVGRTAGINASRPGGRSWSAPTVPGRARSTWRS
ncbi:hypothetical protein V6V16_04115 [Micromonospora sp. CPCC 205561]